MQSYDASLKICAENLGNPIPEDARPTVKTVDDLKQKIEGQLQANGIDPQMNIPNFDV